MTAGRVKILPCKKATEGMKKKNYLALRMETSKAIGTDFCLSSFSGTQANAWHKRHCFGYRIFDTAYEQSTYFKLSSVGYMFSPAQPHIPHS